MSKTTPAMEVDDILKHFYNRICSTAGSKFAGDPYKILSKSALKELDHAYGKEFMGLLPDDRTERKDTNYGAVSENHEVYGHNQAIAELRQAIKERYGL